MKLEIIGQSAKDVKDIASSNADRVEFCSRLLEGGLTPKFDEVKKSLNNNIDVNVMIRTTSKNFYFNKKEFLKMKKDAKRFSKMNINGIVIGILNKDNTINENWTKQLVKIAKKHNKEVTFHRAIDFVPNYDDALSFLNNIGVDRILTTGGLNSIDDNLEQLKKIKDLKKVEVLAGAGININNAQKIAKVTDEIHVGSAVRKDGWESDIDIDKINKFKELIS